MTAAESLAFISIRRLEGWMGTSRRTAGAWWESRSWPCGLDPETCGSTVAGARRSAQSASRGKFREAARDSVENGVAVGAEWQFVKGGENLGVGSW